MSRSIKEYIDHILGDPIPSLDPRIMGNARYQVFEADLLNAGCVLFVIPDQKSIPEVLSQTGYESRPSIIVCDRISKDLRVKLRQSGRSYIIPWREAYIPFLALDFKDVPSAKPQVSRYKIDPVRPAYSFHPMTQCVFLRIFYYHLGKWVAMAQIRNELGSSVDVVRRAFNELSSLGCAEESKSPQGHRLLRLCGSRRQVFESAMSRLISPVVRRHILEGLDTGSVFEAGESTLSAYSILSPPRYPVYACRVGSHNALIRSQYPMTVHTSRSVVLEEWSYDPSLLAKDGRVDPVSLALCYKDNEPVDPRIAMCCFQALYQCLEKDNHGFTVDDLAFLENENYEIPKLYKE